MAAADTQRAPDHGEESGLADSMNRLNVGDHEDAPQKTEEEYAESQLTLRAIVSSKEAGVIIGKQGKNVADLRDETGVKAGVSKVVTGVHDRVLTVTGALQGTAKAYSIVAKGLLEGAPQMGMGGIISNNGTHRESNNPPLCTARLQIRVSVSPFLLTNFSPSHPSVDLTQPDGNHHWSTRSENQAHSGCLGG
jgi:predicted RNA-binding protein YlqC (UPF0109 family)